MREERADGDLKCGSNRLAEQRATPIPDDLNADAEENECRKPHDDICAPRTQKQDDAVGKAVANEDGEGDGGKPRHRSAAEDRELREICGWCRSLAA